MKSLLRVLFILVLFCGVSSFAHAASVDFHVQVLDPVCTVSSPIVCTVVDPSVPFPVTFTTTTCSLFFGSPAPSTNGCFEVINASTVSFTSLDITLTGFGSATFDCPTTGTSPASIFTNSNCGPGEDLSFFGGPGLTPTKTLAVVIQITDQGVADGLTIDDFSGTATVNPTNPTPEPESLLLFSTGAMMMAAGVFMSRRRAFAFGKK
jgi:hypothetical protein